LEIYVHTHIYSHTYVFHTLFREYTQTGKGFKLAENYVNNT